MDLIQEGPRSARIVLVGEAPGANEEIQKRPFIGGSGMLLDRMLDRAGIRRSECFLTNLAHVRPPNNDFAYFGKGGRVRPELLAGLIQLRKDLVDIKPNIVVALGTHPLEYLTGRTGIDKWRGSLLPCKIAPGLKVVGTYHPAYCLRVYDYKAVAEFDLAKAAREAAYPDLRLPRRTIYLAAPRCGPEPSPSDRLHIVWLDAHERAALIEEMAHAEWLSLDIECSPTNLGRWRITCVGFSDRPDRALTIANETDSDWLDITRLATCSAKKVMQNGTFDVSVLLDNGIQVENFEWDTMLAHHTLYAECASGADEMSKLAGKKRQSAIAKGLAFQTALYTNEPYYKDDGKLWAESDEKWLFWRYNALDAAVTKEIQEVQKVELTETNSFPTFRHEMSLVWPLIRATRFGILIDKQAHSELKEKYINEIANLQKFLDLQAGTAVNVKSSKQMLELLYEKFKLPVQRKRKTGNPSADKDAIAALQERHNHPFLNTIIQIRERRDLVERYLNTTYDADGRMRCSFDITGTRSGRLASRASIYGTGTNLQNQPPELRRMFVADPGCIFVQRDYKQAEAMVVAYEAEELGLIELFSDPTRDVHKENASRIFDKPIELVTPEERYLAKRVVHASNYGMQAKKLAMVVNAEFATTSVRITVGQAQRLLDAYFMIYPKIKSVFWAGVEHDIRYRRELRSALGRRRVFYGRWDEKLLNDAYSYKPQSVVGDMACMALVRCDAALPETSHILLNVHDSILVQCPVDDATLVTETMRKCMDIPITIKGRTFSIPSDCEVGYNWGKHSNDNPNGLKKYTAHAHAA